MRYDNDARHRGNAAAEEAADVKDGSELLRLP
jgi:hypothetical protein